jgi:drug/metabolite transporter (DMT)-like permease
MPIWTSVAARFTLGERFTPLRIVGLVLCAVGLAVLVYPLAQSGVPIAILLAIGAAVSWTIGTVYLKWAQVVGDPIVNSGWQLAAGCLTAAAILPVVETGVPAWPLQPSTIAAVLFCGMIGAGIAYLLWYEIVGRLPATTAGLGSLSVPAVGVISSAIVLGERPTLPDIVGFALIFAASSCVLLQPSAREQAPAEAKSVS